MINLQEITNPQELKVPVFYFYGKMSRKSAPVLPLPQIFEGMMPKTLEQVFFFNTDFIRGMTVLGALTTNLDLEDNGYGSFKFGVIK